MPSWRLRVVCGRGETAAIFWPKRLLISVDLPTLGLPMTATKPERNSATSSRCTSSGGGISYLGTEIGHGQAGNDQSCAGDQLPCELLSQEPNAEYHSSQGKQVCDHRRARRADGVDQVVRKNKGKAGSQDPQPQKGDPGDRQLRQAERSLCHRRRKPHHHSRGKQRPGAAKNSGRGLGVETGVDGASG